MTQDILGYFLQCHSLAYFWILFAMSQLRIFLDTFGNIMAQDILGLVWFRVIKGDSMGNNFSTDQHQLMDQKTCLVLKFFTCLQPVHNSKQLLGKLKICIQVWGQHNRLVIHLQQVYIIIQVVFIIEVYTNNIAYNQKLELLSPCLISICPFSKCNLVHLCSFHLTYIMFIA